MSRYLTEAFQKRMYPVIGRGARLEKSATDIESDCVHSWH